MIYEYVQRDYQEKGIPYIAIRWPQGQTLLQIGKYQVTYDNPRVRYKAKAVATVKRTAKQIYKAFRDVLPWATVEMFLDPLPQEEQEEFRRYFE